MRRGDASVIYRVSIDRPRAYAALLGVGALRARLGDGGRFVLIMTWRNPFTRALIGRWWRTKPGSCDDRSDSCQARR